MSDGEFLSKAELHQLTGAARASAQAAWLKAEGIPHQLRDKRVIVCRVHVMSAQVAAIRFAALRLDITPYILRPDAETYPAGAYPPQGEFGGIYMLFDADDALMYVGKSCGVGYRNVQHYWAARRGERGRHACYSALPVPWEYVDGLEVAHIHALEPPENSLPRVQWDRHEEAVKLIQEVWGPKR